MFKADIALQCFQHFVHNTSPPPDLFSISLQSPYLRSFIGMSSSLVDSCSPLPLSSDSVARPLCVPFLANSKKIQWSIFPAAQVFVEPLLSYVAENSAPWQHCQVNVWGLDMSFFPIGQTPNCNIGSTPHFGRNAKCASCSSCRHRRLNSRNQESLCGP
jgi:hypothetical protein